MPRLGTRIPADPSLRKAVWLIALLEVVGVVVCCGEAEYGGGGEGSSCATGTRVCRGGNLGGSDGFGFGFVVGFAKGELGRVPFPNRRTGGFGRSLVVSPVVSIL